MTIRLRIAVRASPPRTAVASPREELIVNALMEITSLKTGRELRLLKPGHQ